jgi:hypothetical protein
VGLDLVEVGYQGVPGLIVSGYEAPLADYPGEIKMGSMEFLG